jgi:hypothetical protein
MGSEVICLVRAPLVRLLVQHVQLTDRPDEIRWRFTANRHYSSKSAYVIQFAGSFADHSWMDLWKAKVENKCKILCWLILQNRLWTADKILKHRDECS